MRQRGAGTIVLSLSLLLDAACAPAVRIKELKQENIEGIRKLAVVTFLRDKQLQIVDRRPARERPSYSGYYGPYGSTGSVGTDLGLGALAGLLQALGEMAGSEMSKSSSQKYAKAEKITSLGGQEDSLKRALSDFDVKKLFDEIFSESFPVRFEVVGAREVNKLGIDEFPEVESVRGDTIRDYGALRDALGVNAVLQIDFMYGLASYGKEIPATAGAVISAHVSVINVEKNEVVMRKIISSDYAGIFSEHYKSYTLDEFAANNGELFKQELRKAIGAFARLVAREFRE